MARRPPIVIDEPDISIPRQEVESSCLTHVGYDEEQRTLYLTYRPTGMTYVYFDFSPADFDQFMIASSLGQYVNKVIKPLYHCLDEE